MQVSFAVVLKGGFFVVVWRGRCSGGDYFHCPARRRRVLRKGSRLSGAVGAS